MRIQKTTSKSKKEKKERLQEIANWYDKVYEKEGHRWGVPPKAYMQFPKHLGIPSYYVNRCCRLKALDVACGKGYLLNIFDRYNLYTVGTEISEEAIKLSKFQSPNSIIYKCPAENMVQISDNYFDYVTCIGSLEHFIDIDKSLQEMYRVGNKDALYCILVPNRNSLFENHTDQQEINERFYSLKTWKRIFRNNGFKINKVIKDEWHIIKPQSIIKSFLNWIVPLKWSNSLVFILSKRDNGSK